MTEQDGRHADFPIAPMFLQRWSPRSFSSEEISDDDLFTLFEAARWAPSSSNLQPWRFLYVKRGTTDWPLFLDVLNEGNRGWAEEASALLAIVSKRTAPVKGSDAMRENHSHSFDAGAAWAYLALQASLLGWVAHGIGGFDRDRAVRDLGVPDDYRVECMVAVGRFRPDPDRPAHPKGRSPQASFVRQGRFPPSA